MKAASEVLPAPVMAYIESTRFALPAHDFSGAANWMVHATYDPHVDALDRIGAAFGVRIPVGLVYTDMMRSEVITMKGQSYIVHDQYLGQVINMMNRLYLYGASRKTKLVYFNKLASQMMSRYGFYPEAVYAANCYRDLRRDMDHEASQASDGSFRHGLYTAVQELFVLLHEQAHVIFKRHPDLLDAMSDDARTWLAAYAAPRRVDGARRKASMQALGWSAEEQAAADASDRDDAHRQEQIASCATIASRQDLIEEFCCDQMALINVLGYFESGTFSVPDGVEKRAYKGVDRVTAILLCFLNMRTLQTMESICNLEKNVGFATRDQTTFSFREGLYVTFYNARLHRAKDLCYDLALDDDEEPAAVHEMVTRMMDSHTDEIFAPATSTIRALLYEADLRADMDRMYAPLAAHAGDRQHFNRTITATRHLVPDAPDDGGRDAPADQP